MKHCRLKENKNLECIYLTKENVNDFLHTEFKEMFEQGTMTIVPEFNKYLVELTEKDKMKYKKQDNIDDVIEFITNSVK